jgi:hypothetical protein
MLRYTRTLIVLLKGYFGNIWTLLVGPMVVSIRFSAFHAISRYPWGAAASMQF